MKQVATKVELVDFVKTVKSGLEYGLADMSLELKSLELLDMGSKILTIDSRMYPWMLRGIVNNPITGQHKLFSSQFQAAIRDTDVESVRTLVVDIIGKIKKAFYP